MPDQPRRNEENIAEAERYAHAASEAIRELYAQMEPGPKPLADVKTAGGIRAVASWSAEDNDLTVVITPPALTTGEPEA